MKLIQNDAPVVIPDLHGYPEFLQAVLDTFPNRYLLQLGDLVDRGPDTPGLLALVKPLVESGQMTVLIGNHDDFFLRTLLDGFQSHDWNLHYAGPTTGQYASRDLAISDARWMREHLQPWHVWRHVYLSHAAPHQAIDDAIFPAHLWGRPGDDRAPLPSGCTLAVHGHTSTISMREDQQPLPVMRRNIDGTVSLYLDTAAFHTDVLTILDLADMQFHALSGHRRPG